MNSGYSVERFLEYVRTSRSKNTLTMYRQGLKRFTEWYGKNRRNFFSHKIIYEGKKEKSKVQNPFLVFCGLR